MWVCAALLYVLAYLAAPIAVRAGPPFLTDDPQPVEWHHFEFYVFSTMDKTPQGTTTAGPTVEYNIGAVPNVQLHIVLPFVFNTPVNGVQASGFGDAEIGVKYRFVQETRDRPQIGTFPMAEVATGDAGKGLGNGRTWFRLPLWAQERKQKTPMESTFF